MKQTVLTAFFFLFVLGVKAQKQSISSDTISVYFDELNTASKKNIGLWNKDLYGPMMLIDPKTREFFANEPDSEGILKRNGTIYSGVLPAAVNIANTAINWGGKRWAMIMLPLSQNKENRINLLAHESFHSIQPSLGFTLNNAENSHLDQKEGRIYLRLELEALKQAVRSSSEKEYTHHLTNALTFRKYRNRLYKGSENTENLLELNEGIAEFTGLIVSGRNKDQTRLYLLNGIDGFMKNPTFVRSFAYYTTPVYGYLLYLKDPDWNKKINAKTDLTGYFIKAFDVRIQTDLQKAVEKLSDNYNGTSTIKEETEREEQTKKRIAEYKMKFIQQPHFEIKFEKMNVSFDPRNIVPVEDHGTVYPNIRITDLWGILTIENGALMSPNWDKISISNPVSTENKKVSGDGWILELTDGYTIAKDEGSGNYKLLKN
ncbi:hypothetical protein WH221_16785 [Chryseobacterium culicis]|uniref:Uncharacterized protein n=1 Tax=Chryseobacterium culicis TaxID=680127 RepID=A0A2S9CPC0_CHRCI|nr:hypothetical protein [Chryseobacterium culicis]PRB82343.1 hypothetical protein CQ022_16745 [Chryseobacterium culicis]PRB88718.1 hypothetical protein CQ033_15640 [Chryseobacterium culicis]